MSTGNCEKCRPKDRPWKSHAFADVEGLIFLSVDQEPNWGTRDCKGRNSSSIREFDWRNSHAMLGCHRCGWWNQFHPNPVSEWSRYYLFGDLSLLLAGVDFIHPLWKRISKGPSGLLDDRHWFEAIVITDTPVVILSQLITTIGGSITARACLGILYSSR